MSNQKTTGNGSVATLPEEKVERIPLADLHISEHNTRQPKPAEVAELALSMKETGQTTPAIVRPHPKEKGKFEIAAGARRFVAAKVNGWEAMAAVVRPLDDNTFEELLLVENLQREDPDPRAEVELIDRLVKRGVHTPEQISAHLGKPKLWASRRIQLLKVIPELRKQWSNATGNSNTSLAHFGVEMMELVGSLPVETQELFLERENWELRRCTSLKDLRKVLDARVFCRLDQAPFDLNDKRFFVKGCGPGCACDSSALQSLFGDSKEPARCLKVECFNQRVGLAMKAKYDEAAKGESLPVISTDHRAPDALMLGEKRVKVDRVYDWEHSVADKPSKNSKKVLVVSTAGNLRVAYLSAKQRGGGRDKVKSPAARLTERKKILQGKRWLLVHEQLAKSLIAATHSQVTESVVDLLAVFGSPERAQQCYGDMKHWREFDNRKTKGWPVRNVARLYEPRSEPSNEKTREAAIWKNVRAVILDVMKPVGNVGDTGRYEAMMRRVAKLITFPIEERKRESDKKILPPKTWGPVDVHTLEPLTLAKSLTKQLDESLKRTEAKGYVLTCTREGRRHYCTGERADEGKWTKFIEKARVFGSAGDARKAIGKSKALILPLSRTKKASPSAAKSVKKVSKKK